MYKKILIIIQRSNGDVFLSIPLIERLHKEYPQARIDMLVNHDTLATAKTLPYINNIHIYDYSWKRNPFPEKIKKEFSLIKKLLLSYDLTINLTSSDRSVLYARLFGNKAISCVEPDLRKSWWKRVILSKTFNHDINRHIVKHNIKPLEILKLGIENPSLNIKPKIDAYKELKKLSIDLEKPFVVFHPSAQYEYKIYPKVLRDSLLKMLDTLDIQIAVTGGKSSIDKKISKELPPLKNLHNLIGKTSLDGFIALCAKADAYIGMDTLNMHIAAALDKRIFAIFGPTLPQIWSPWCNSIHRGTSINTPIQTYGNITLFQADMPCVSCGKAGCDDRHGHSECLDAIEPDRVFKEVKRWLEKSV